MNLKIMRNIFLLIVLLFIFSCNKKESKLVYKDTKLNALFHPIFAQIDMSNDIARSRIEKETKTSYLEKMKEPDFIKDYPVVFETGIDAGSGFSWVKFRTALLGEFENKKQYINYDSYSFEIIGKIPTEKAEKLQINVPYFISGSLIEKGWKNEPYIVYLNPEGKMNFGTVTYKITDIKH